MENCFVIIDSNFLFLPIQFKIDYLEDIKSTLGGKTKIIYYQQIFDELSSKQIREPNARKFEMDLRASLQYLEKKKENYNIQFINKKKNSNETTDDFLITECVNYRTELGKVYLATNDSNLRKKANEQGIHTIFLKQKSYLIFD
ncbi:MAG: PIN domain-containing protein [Candidatus Thorarchaeota archaeon]